MVVVSQCPNLSEKELGVFHTTDQLLSNDPIVVLYGLSTTLSANGGSNSRIQCHVFTSAGFQSYPRLAVSPNSPLYKAVECLPREEQGDEVCRGLAFGLLKYFSELPEIAKKTWIKRSLSRNASSPDSHLFSALHAATLASRMTQVVDGQAILGRIDAALTDQSVSVIDVDVVLPPGSIGRSGHRQHPVEPHVREDDVIHRYGAKYASMVKLFGSKFSLETPTGTEEHGAFDTSAKRTTSFTKAQKERLRVEMCELLDTEENYVRKLQELADITAAIHRAGLNGKHSNGMLPDPDMTEHRFTSFLNTISEVNHRFLEGVRLVLDASENTAIEDIESTSELGNALKETSHNIVQDVTGVSKFAEVLLRFFPDFVECYGSYIDSYPQFLHHFKLLQGNWLASGMPLLETKDQQLMSLLIEPIQRLPRYSLYIENIVKQLPSNHPALNLLIAAKKMIDSVCTQDSNTAQQFKLSRLRKLIASWPARFEPDCRFLIAADADVIEPPYSIADDQTSRLHHWMMLLFPGHLLVVKIGTENAASARLLMADLECIQHSIESTSKRTESQNWDISVIECLSLSDIDFTETNGGSRIRMLPSSTVGKQRRKEFLQSKFWGQDRVRAFQLRGDFRGKAKQWVGEAIKARIRGRGLDLDCADSINRELRRYNNYDGELTLVSAVFEDCADSSGRLTKSYAPVRIILGAGAVTSEHGWAKEDIEILATISEEGNGFYRLNVEAANERATRDLVTGAELMPVLARRIGSLLQMRHQTRNPRVVEDVFSHNHSVLNSLKLTEIQAELHTVKLGTNRSTSPVKVLSNLFAGVALKDTGSLKKPLPALPVLGDAPQFLASTKTVKSLSEPDLIKQAIRALPRAVDPSTVFETPVLSHIQMLESTFSSYILALHARKGNVVGKALASRALADEAAVKELYEVLLQNPASHERAAQSSVDVLFEAFDKFVKLPWREVMGPIVNNQMLTELQQKSETLGPLEYEDYLSQKIADLAPQNQRAFKAIVGLLTDLLGGMGNDGDRGSLTATIAEIIVCDDEPHKFIPLFDRLVADCDIVINPSHRSGAATPTFGSLTPVLDRAATETSSYKSSSFSKRFGFGSVHRQSSKTETHAMGSVSRLWSRGHRPADYPSKEMISPSKPGSFDRRTKTLKPAKVTDQPTVLDIFNEEHRQPQPVTPSLGQIDLGSPFSKNLLHESPKPVKKKRRSSLSDLTTNKASPSKNLWKTPGSRLPDIAPQLPKPVQASPLTSSLSFMPTFSTSTPPRSVSVRDESPSRKENTRPVHNKYQTLRERPFSYRGEDYGDYKKAFQSVSPNDILATPDNFKVRRSPSMIPVPRAILSERSTSGNFMAPPKQSPVKYEVAQVSSSSRKPHVQTPQKLSQRLQMQQKAISKTEQSVRLELEQIGKDVSRLVTETKLPPKSGQSLEDQNQARLISNLGTRLKALESKVPHLIGTLQSQTTALEGHVSELLHITEKKIKVLDVRLRQSNEENVALYERNNEELMQVFAQVKGGHAVEELKMKLSESMKEAEMWKRECKGLNTRTASTVADIHGNVVKAGERLRGVMETV